MCLLDMIVGPSPILIGGTVFIAAIGILLLSGIVLVTIGFMKSKEKKDNDTEETE